MREGTSSLTARDYERVFRVLERVDTAETLTGFKAALLDALGAELGFRHTTFFSGTTYNTLFQDPEPLLNGRPVALFREYRTDWCEYDVFRLPEARAVLERTFAVSAGELGALPQPALDYVDHWLVRRGVSNAAAMCLTTAGGRALVGVFGDDGSIGAKEMTVLRLLGRQLSAVARGLQPAVRPLTVGHRLSPRQREVAELVARGLTNSAIGATLALSEDTVKKYVSRVLSATGCRSRTELAIHVRR
ncbi:LuxR C-terminal-related transcriptional regulator [Amycolatopsis rhabdoformis]|uniref:LuxR C-terminal-related transcriptional regulator n=1 Tax=Amycolatopsis rhabdoformis TaxID=1448059 RepID=A0ABZ1IEI1_9PSEU|nr:LuxR C-terminal-related transcriptional regulator [Amycolatopsis rhabdoformis]WSE32496.1 LuxR C-terminal-related transcriptional regulator [Amycolatopsis rhabdoformis]